MLSDSHLNIPPIITLTQKIIEIKESMLPRILSFYVIIVMR